MPPNVPDWVWIENVVFPILGMGIGTLFAFGLYRLINRALDRRHELRLAERTGGVDSEAVARLAERVEVLEEQAIRVQELEERVDFAERLLTRGKEDQHA